MTDQDVVKDIPIPPPADADLRRDVIAEAAKARLLEVPADQPAPPELLARLRDAEVRLERLEPDLLRRCTAHVDRLAQSNEASADEISAPPGVDQGLGLTDLGRMLAGNVLRRPTLRAVGAVLDVIDRIAALVSSPAWHEAGASLLLEWHEDILVPETAAVLAMGLSPREPLYAMLRGIDRAKPAVRRALAPYVASREPAAVPAVRPSPAVHTPPDAFSKAALSRAAAEGHRTALFELEVPEYLLSAPARPVPGDATPIARGMWMRWHLSVLPTWPSLKVCRVAATPAAREGALAVVVGLPASAAEPGEPARLIAFRPVPHLQPHPGILAELPLGPDVPRVDAAVSGGGEVYAAVSGKTSGVRLLVAEEGRWREVFSRECPVPQAMLVPAPDPLLVWWTPTGDASGGASSEEAWAVRASAPGRPFRWPVGASIFAEARPDGTVRMLDSAAGGLSWLDVLPDGRTVATPIPWATDDVPRAAVPLGDGRYLLVADRERWERRGTGGGGAPRHVCFDSRVVGAVVSGDGVDAVETLVRSTGEAAGRVESRVEFAAVAAPRNVCLVTRRIRIARDEGSEVRRESVDYEIGVFDSRLRPVVGPRFSSLLAARAGGVEGDVQLVPRADGTLSFLTAASVEPVACWSW